MTFVHSLAWNYANAGDANDFVYANNHEGPISRKVNAFPARKAVSRLPSLYSDQSFKNF